MIPLNDSGNVYVLPKVGPIGRIKLEVNVRDTKDDVRIQKNKWGEMAEEFHARADSRGIYWAPALDYIDIEFLANVKAPSDMSNMFFAYNDNDKGGSIKGLERLDVSEVTDASRAFSNIRCPLDGESFANWDTGNINNFEGMFLSSPKVNPNVSNWNMKNARNLKDMFDGATLANPDISKWHPELQIDSVEDAFQGSAIEKADISKWNVYVPHEIDEWGNDHGVHYSYKGELFNGCQNLKYLKTPPELPVFLNEIDHTFKIVKLQENKPASIEKESINLKSGYSLNKDGDRTIAYNIYRKNIYAGVTFDVNGGNKESFRNHEIVEKGKSIKESAGVLPEKKPEKNLYRHVGWDKNPIAQGKGDFNENTPVDKDTIVYAMYEKKIPAKVRFNAAGGNLGSVPAEINSFAYLFMDVLRYQDAYVTLRDVERNPVFGDLMNLELKGLLKRQVETLKILQEGSIKETPQNLVDLYFNMQRCFERGNYADVLARF